ncbi:MAG: hypothetical protein GY754_15055 [bacterium]|nr:hypothetical protein [bacterium]
MKKLLCSIILLMLIPVFTMAQKPGTGTGTTAPAKKGSHAYKLSSKKLDDQGEEMDKQIAAIATDIANIIKENKLLETKGIRILPYQTTYTLEKDFIELERHTFIRDEVYKRNIVGVKTKSLKIYTNGSTVNKLEVKIYEKLFYGDDSNLVEITDPSPTTTVTTDVEFSHILKGRKILDKKKLGDIKNTTAFPLRNEIKREFLIPHLTTFRNALRDIASSYYKSLKDSEDNMSEFLKKSTKY